MYTLEIEIPLFDTDPNKTRGSHWTATSARNKKIKSIVHLLTRGKTPEAPLESFKISVTRHGPRALDWDNLVASLKPYLDQLKNSGIIIDDSWKYIRQINTNQVISTEKKIVIRVSEEGLENN